MFALDPEAINSVTLISLNGSGSIQTNLKTTTSIMNKRLENKSETSQLMSKSHYQKQN